MVASNSLPPGIEYERYKWLKRNRGVLVRVAQELAVGVPTVSRVLNGHAVSRRIEDRLRQLRAPGFTKQRNSTTRRKKG